MKRIALIFLIFAVTVNPAFGKARYAGKLEMIREAEFIAVVEINNIEETEKNGSYWTYNQKAIGTIEKVLKGKAEGRRNSGKRN